MDKKKRDNNEDQEMKVQYIPTYIQIYKQMNNISKRQEAHKSFFCNEKKNLNITIP